jgi:hypothetical protein
MANFGNFGNIIISKKKFGWDVVSVSTPNEDELIAIDNIKKLLKEKHKCILYTKSDNGYLRNFSTLILKGYIDCYACFMITNFNGTFFITKYDGLTEAKNFIASANNLIHVDKV